MVFVERSVEFRLVAATVISIDGAGVSDTREFVLRQLQSRFPDVQVQMPLNEGSQNVELGKYHVIAATKRTVSVQGEVQIPLGAVIPHPNFFVVMPRRRGHSQPLDSRDAWTQLEWTHYSVLSGVESNICHRFLGF